MAGTKNSRKLYFFRNMNIINPETNQNSFTVIEQSVASKKEGTLPEDICLVTDDFVMIGDGATSKSKDFKIITNPTTGEIVTSGRLAAQVIAQRLSELDANIEPDIAIVELNNAIAQKYKELGLYEYMQSHSTDRMTASVIIYSRARGEIWILGDCQHMIDGVHNDNAKLIDEITGRTRSEISSLLQEGRTIEEIRAKVADNAAQYGWQVDTSELTTSQLQKSTDAPRTAIMSMLSTQQQFQNRPEGSPEHPLAYDVIDGLGQQNAGRVKVIKLTPGDHEIVLASDGYPQLARTLADSEIAREELLEQDSLLIGKSGQRYMSTKGMSKGQQSYDDRAYIRFNVHVS